MVQEQDIHAIWFLGIGGIGMSALARYYHAVGYTVAGYDRTPSDLTLHLESEGIHVTYADDPSCLQAPYDDPKHTLVVRTPAVPEENRIYTTLREGGYDIRKRAEVLGIVTRQKHALCVAGSHGKTTTSTMLAHIMKMSQWGTNAFLGGISNNYETNLLLEPKSQYAVVEADEFDRSFHHLNPWMSVITSADADHLDIYGTPEAYRESFEHYSSLIEHALLLKKGVQMQPRLQASARLYTYSATEEADFYATNIRIKDEMIHFDFVTPESVMENIIPGVPVMVNVENSVAAMAMAWLCGVEEDVIRESIRTYKGVYRRFDRHIETDHLIYIDDYAHHPIEIEATLRSVRALYPNRRLTVIFQPHLYTRTRDLVDDFARVLSDADEVVLIPIYPARELPIEGVTSEWLLSKITAPMKMMVSPKEALPEFMSKHLSAVEEHVVLTLGAGDIDREIKPLTEALR